MRTLLIVGLVVVVLFMAGWLKFSSPEGNPTIKVDTVEVQQDSRAVIERGKEAIDDVQRAAENGQ